MVNGRGLTETFVFLVFCKVFAILLTRVRSRHGNLPGVLSQTWYPHPPVVNGRGFTGTFVFLVFYKVFAILLTRVRSRHGNLPGVASQTW